MQGVVAHISHLNSLSGWGRKIAHCLGNLGRPCLKMKVNKRDVAQWESPGLNPQYTKQTKTKGKKHAFICYVIQFFKNSIQIKEWMNELNRTRVQWELEKMRYQRGPSPFHPLCLAHPSGWVTSWKIPWVLTTRDILGVDNRGLPLSTEIQVSFDGKKRTIYVVYIFHYESLPKRRQPPKVFRENRTLRFLFRNSSSHMLCNVRGEAVS